MDVTDVLRDRAQPPDGLQRMLLLSFGVHIVFFVVLLAMPGVLVGRRADEPRNVMTISLSGAGEGPRNGGFTAAAAQPVQVQTPPEDAAKREPPRPPAAKTPEMVMPTTAAARPAKTPAPVVKNAPDDAKGRTPTRGAEPSKGQAAAFTGARGQGFGGLSTGGGPGSGSTLDVADFCCPDYLATMIDRVRSGWQNNQGATGMCIVKFTIQRTGQITDATVEKSSGLSTLDLAALRAVIGTRTLNPLPAAFPNPTLGVHLTFEYR
ncbi:MAG TPA: TonB family protein [Vicinamibacterales bacterium]|jgi:protein TonB